MHDRTLALLTFLFFGSELGLALFRRSRRTLGATRADAGSLRLLWIVITLAVTLAFAVSGFRRGRLPFPPTWIRNVALVLLAGGLAFRWWADHALVSTGPFRYVRHPSYTGLLLAFLGLGVSLGNLLSLLVLMTPIVVTLSYRMRVEEEALRQSLGASYEDYCARTKRLIPGVV